MRLRILLSLAVLAAALPSLAQSEDDPHWQFHAGIGWPAAVGSSQSSANGLMHTMAGAVRTISPRLAFRIDGEYDAFNPSDRVLRAYGSHEGRAQVYSLSADLQYRFFGIGWGHVYGFGGAGTHYKHAYLNSPTTGVACDPWWGVCYPVGSDIITSTKTDTGYGANAGIGYQVPLTTESQIFIEFKYQWVNTRKAGGAEWVPITIGARF